MTLIRVLLTGVLLSLATIGWAEEKPGRRFGVDYVSGHAGVKHFAAVLVIDDQHLRVTDGRQPPRQDSPCP